MRNLLEYPVTKEEIISFLQSISNDLMKNDLSCGDMRMVLIDEAIKIIENYKNFQTKFDLIKKMILEKRRLQKKQSEFPIMLLNAQYAALESQIDDLLGLNDDKEI